LIEKKKTTFNSNHHSIDAHALLFHRRYIFEKAKKTQKVNIQELGPSFCLKLRSLQRGAFDPTEGEFEWLAKSNLKTSQKKFFL
jgi:ribosome production factor 1